LVSGTRTTDSTAPQPYQARCKLTRINTSHSTLTSPQGKDDLLQSLFTSFAPFNQGAAFAIISEERTIITRACESKRFSQRHARGHRLYQLLMTQDDRGILAFGTSEGRNDSFLFNFPVTTTIEQLDCRNKTKIPGLTNRSKFVPAITTTTYNSHNQRHLLIAVMEDRMVRTIRLDLET
jgi:hypothetical protein